MDGNHLLRFKLWDSMTGGRQVWEESQYVAVRAGVYDAVVGRIRPLPPSGLSGGYRLAVEPPEGTGWQVQGVRLLPASKQAGTRAAAPPAAAPAGGDLAAGSEAQAPIPPQEAPSAQPPAEAEWTGGLQIPAGQTYASPGMWQAAGAARQPARAPAPRAEAPAGPRPRIYVVRPGDTLMTISREVYGAPDRWLDLYHANFDRIQRGGDVTPGQKLLIP